MTPYPTIIDCDPGTDDIAALILARQLTALDVRAITVTAGNTELVNGVRNALDVTALLDWDVPVAAGAARPLTRTLVTAAEYHGQDGMRGVVIPRAGRKTDSRPAWQMIYEIAKASQVPIDLVVTGPMTNVAIALATYDDLPKYLRRIIAMGGAVLAGNTTAAAEYNFYVDPEAAERVLHSGVPVWLLPLDVTHQAYITREELAAVKELGTPAARLFYDVMDGYYNDVLHYSNGRGSALHDPTAVLYAADDSYFTSGHCFIGVETRGTITCGMMVTDRYSDKKLTPNAHLVETIDRETFIARIFATLNRY
ncbi:MAG: nucleoside hydrolase [Promicromonosporaceae bacterium]|nr:nucleoside hydrolase [Promicromonosporaceae bacterium]